MALGNDTLIIEAYVVVGDDDRICDREGRMPDSLKNDAEWKFFQGGLDAADITVLGRKSHDITPNHKNRRRLIMTRSVDAISGNDREVFWNPSKVPLDAALKRFGAPERKHLAVVGGQSAFDYFLTRPHRFTKFHLSRVHGVTIPGGRSVFSASERDRVSAEAILIENGFTPQPAKALDRGVDVVTWLPVAD